MNKKKWYRGGFVKGFWLTAVHLAALAAALSFLVIMYLGEVQINPFEKNTDYTKSQTFGNQLYHNAIEILVNLRNSDLVTDTDQPVSSRVVDLQEILDGKEISGHSASGLAYSVEDLVKWTEDGYWQTGYWIPEDGRGILVCKKMDNTYEYFYYDEFARKVNDKELLLVTEENYDGPEYDCTEEVLQQLYHGQCPDGVQDGRLRYITDKDGRTLYTNVWNYANFSVEEAYPPKYADSILDVVNKNSKWNGRLSEAFSALNEALDRVSYARQSKETLEKYAEGSTNLSYLYVDRENGQAYTNRQAYENYEQYEASLKKMMETGAYLIFTPNMAELRTNLEMLSTEPSNNPFQCPRLQEWQLMVDAHTSSDFVFAMQVDTEFPVSDFLSENRWFHEHYAGYGKFAITAGAVSVMVFLIGFIWLTATAGRRKEDEEIHLNAFDYWYTEAAAGIVFGAWIGVLWIFGENFSYGRDLIHIRNCLSAGGFALATVALFFMGWLSLVRRVKARILWKGSLLRAVLRLLKKGAKKSVALLEILSDHTLSKIKAIVIFTGFVFLQTIFSIIAVISGSLALLLLVFLADAAALVWVVYKAHGRDCILTGLKRISGGELQYKIPLERLRGEQKVMAELINNIGSGLDAAVENSLKNERMKTELITNVSHDIKTPLTSIINYIDLLKRENFTDEKVCGYLDVLTEKAQRLKVLTEDVVEASKASTGNISLEMTPLNFAELLQQVMGEFEEKFESRNLTMMVHFDDEPSFIYADGRRMWRVLENVFNNIAKYAMEGTRVYASVEKKNRKVVFSLKNISAQPLNFSADELTERFIRGDVSRNTEGSGLGLSIAKSLTELQGGEFKLYLDGDLFKVVITFAEKEEK